MAFFSFLGSVFSWIWKQEWYVKLILALFLTIVFGYIYMTCQVKEAKKGEQRQKEARATRDAEIINEGEKETKEKTEKADKSNEKLKENLKKDSQEFEATQSEIDKKFCSQFPNDSTCKK
jgi:hypothetical protein